ncbi:AT-hook motif nuclear-localized protein 7-like [Mercurialis annua]|uniref:AT-hook motif nuclear-localized protein 7-like n=1 Tax=Mercurialis annua TaxID=3986 RepID=UPI00215E6EBC|nr:AT-hook motif nuclear-localized protein 7-like [Mercurialis annua]
MEAVKEGVIISSSGSGLTVKGNEAPESYRVAPIPDNSIPNPNLNPNLNSNPNSNPISNPNPNLSFNSDSNPNPNTIHFGGPPVTVSPPVGGDSTGKKKRGRPRKYAQDGALVPALSPMPISSSIPLAGDFSSSSSSWKRGRGRPLESVKKQHKFEYENTGERIAYFVGANFTPHVLTVNAGEDVTMKVMSFSQQGARAICILSANGTISNVTLRQPTTSGGTLTYEGRFEILSLSGSYMPTDSGGTKSRSGGMSVALAGPDGRVVGGGLAGLLIAAGPVQVVVGSFLQGHEQEQKHKNQRIELPPVVSPVNIVSPEAMKAGYGSVKPVLVTSSYYHGDNSASLNSSQAFRNPASDNKTSSHEDGSRGLDLSNCEISS